MTRLKALYLGFCSRFPGGTGHRPSPLVRSVLHALTTLWFSGNSEYLEFLFTLIDAPQLNDINITFSDMSAFAFDTPQFLQFTNRTEIHNAFNRAIVRFYCHCVEVTLSSESLRVDQPSVRLRVSWAKYDWQLLCLVRLCRSTFPLPLLSILEYLEIYNHWNPCIYSTDLWLELLGLFSFVKSLSLSDNLTLPVMAALGELVGGRVLELLPVLQNVRLHPRGLFRSPQDAVGPFVAVRKLSGHPVAVHRVEPGGWIEDACRDRERKNGLCFLS